MAWAKNGTPDTLGSSGDLMTISDMEAKKFNMILESHYDTGGLATSKFTLNNNTNSVYARRQSLNGGTEFTAGSETGWTYSMETGNGDFFVGYLCSISGEEKLLIMPAVDSYTAGAGTAPSRKEYVGKFVPSPDADVTRIDATNIAVGSYDTSSNLSAIGTD